ncbi:hypothetical protein TSUD_175850 [Trifolium subterraneum]|uniref:F-box domain-containing protein n=1 Tax=Trifolium subterraneum TaxID=3900 RepID=A0A2Z6M7U7_TRISU|nr:hypothetical protein TSUD_175850 [Trifolium subterraneum]
MEENNILTNLPVDTLELIMKRLSLNDNLALRAICRSCRKTISNVIEKKHCRCHLPEIPQVFLLSRNSNFFFSLSKKSVHHHLRTPALWRYTYCIGSVEGWLILSDYSKKGFAKCSFLNPVTHVRIMIPSKLSLSTYSLVRGNRKPCVSKMVASSKPSCDGSSDCYLVGLLNDYCHIAIYKLFDKSWNIVESDKDSGSYFMDVEIINGTKLYAIGGSGDTSSRSILIYDLKDSTDGPPKAKVLAKIPTISPSESHIIRNHCLSFLGKDEALRELYFIFMFNDGAPAYETQNGISDRLKIISAFPEPPQVTDFEVFKLDTDKDPIEWQNVQLKDSMAFVSNYNSMVISRDEINYFNKDLIRENSIYFAIHLPCPTNPWSGLQLGMFDLTDRSIKYFPVETLTDGDVPYPLWFVPSLL